MSAGAEYHSNMLRLAIATLLSVNRMVFMAVFSFPLIPISFLFFLCTLPVNRSYKQEMLHQKDVLLRHFSQCHCLLWKKRPPLCLRHFTKKGRKCQNDLFVTY